MSWRVNWYRANKNEPLIITNEIGKYGNEWNDVKINGECICCNSGTEFWRNLKYNNEDSLAFVVCYAYFACNENYLPFIREFPTGKGFADIVFIPKEGKWRSNPILVIELKWDKTAQTALNQIKERHYPEYFENSKGNIVLVGINYDKDSKKHTCKIELLDRS